MKSFFIILVGLIILFSPSISFAESSYVLPYPSTMPGTIFYKLRVIEEKIIKYLYFGDYGQFNYNLKEADKYLVEAKTLFEYKQYLLGAKALQESDSYFSKTLPYLENAKSHGKNISDKRELLHQASLKHIEVLKALIINTPSDFLWSPEKTASTPLPLGQLLNRSIEIRKRYL